MSSTKFVGLIAVLNLAAAGMFATYAHKTHAAAAVEQAEFRREAARLRNEAQAVRRQLEAARAARATMAAQPSGAPNAMTATAASTRQPKSNERPTDPTRKPASATVQALYESHNAASDETRQRSDYTPYLIRNARREVMRVYADVFDALHLPPDRLERLKQLLTDQELASSDASLLAERQSAPVGSTADAQVRRNVGDDTNRAIRELLGEAAYVEFRTQVAAQRYNRAVLDDCNTALAEQGLPPIDAAKLLECSRGQRPPAHEPKTREEWVNVLRPIVASAMSPQQFEIYIDQAYAWRRQAALRAQIVRQVASSAAEKD